MSWEPHYHRRTGAAARQGMAVGGLVLADFIRFRVFFFVFFFPQALIELAFLLLRFGLGSFRDRDWE